MAIADAEEIGDHTIPRARLGKAINGNRTHAVRRRGVGVVRPEVVEDRSLVVREDVGDRAAILDELDDARRCPSCQSAITSQPHVQVHALEQ